MSSEEAAEKSEELRELVLKSLGNDEKLARRFETIHTVTATQSGGATSSKNSGCDNETIRAERIVDREDRSPLWTQESAFGFAFDKDLRASRVYGRLTYEASDLSLTSSRGRSRGWSVLSGISLLQISNISVVSLPITAAELYDSYHYSADTSKCLANGDQAAQVNAIWPPWRVASWFRFTDLGQWLLDRILTDHLSGWSILSLQRKHMANYTSLVAGQDNLWSQVKLLQICISGEVSNWSNERSTKPTNPESSNVVSHNQPHGHLPDLLHSAVVTATRYPLKTAEASPQSSEGSSRAAIPNQNISIPAPKIEDIIDDYSHYGCESTQLEMAQGWRYLEFIAANEHSTFYEKFLSVHDGYDHSILDPSLPLKWQKTMLKHNIVFLDYLHHSLYYEEEKPGLHSGREHLSRLRRWQIEQLSTDVYNELIRRCAEHFEEKLSGTLQSLQYISPPDESGLRRRKAQKKLAILPLLRLRALSADVCSEIETRAESCAHEGDDQNASPATSVQTSPGQPTMPTEGTEDIGIASTTDVKVELPFVGDRLCYL